MKMNAQMLNETVSQSKAARKDDRYLHLLTQCRKYEDQYCRILSSLSQADQDTLEEYISLCQELEFRRGCVAAELKRSRDAETDWNTSE